MTGYIYCITNRINGRRYIGLTTTTLAVRMKNHRAEMHRQENLPLYNAMRKYGVENFDVRPVMTIEDVDVLKWLNLWEPLCIEHFQTLKPNGYNLALGGGAFSFTPEIRAKMSAARKGKKGHKWTDEQRAHLSALKKGVPTKPHTEESKAKMSAALRGKKKPHTSETFRLIHTGNKYCVGRVMSPETRAKIGAKAVGREQSEETRNRRSIALKGKPKTPEHVAAIMAGKERKKLLRQETQKIGEQI